jgi:tetratricopeptide (TPR) repeat protein
LVAKSRTLEKELADVRRAAQTNADLISALQTALRRAQEEKDAPAEEKKQAKTPSFDRRLDGTNVLIRANLAAALIGQNRLAEGEETLKRALAGDPNNTASLTLLGVVKVRQHKYDEALDLLSQSAQLDPQNADTFQYLGVTLVAKGLRKPAESAFRRAIQLAPENAEAHHNLAIVYATQQPPALELARLHYQKGLAGGHPIDAKLEQLLSANKPAAVGGINALNR